MGKELITLAEGEEVVVSRGIDLGEHEGSDQQEKVQVTQRVLLQ